MQVRDGEINVVGFHVDRHGPGAGLGFYVLDEALFVRRVFMDDGQRAVAA